MKRSVLSILFFVLTFHFNPAQAQQISTQDSLELLNFAFETGAIDAANAPIAAGWNNTTNIPLANTWNPNVNNIANWYGLTIVDSAGTGIFKIQKIDLSNLPLNTSISFNLEKMNWLTELRLDSCGLSDVIPANTFSVGLDSLQLISMNDNQLDPSVTTFSSFVVLPALLELSMAKAFDLAFTNALNFQLVPTLKTLNLSKNNFNGNLDFSAGIGLEMLENIDVSDNQFSNLIVPTQLFDLKNLNLSNNLLTTADFLVNVLDSAFILENFIANNALDTNGLLHSFLPQANYLASFDMGKVEMRYNNFSGYIALEYFGDVTLTNHLDLSHNQLDSIVGFTSTGSSIKYLNISHNQISMQITYDLINQVQGIEEYYINDNDFSGKIEFVDSRFEFLRRMDLSNNPKLGAAFNLEDLLGAQDVQNAPFESLKLVNNNFENIIGYPSGTSAFNNFKELKVEGNQLHFDDLFALVRSFNCAKDTSVFDPATGNSITQFIPPYWVQGPGQGISFDTLQQFSYWPQDSAGVGGVRRRPANDSVFFSSTVGFDPEIVNTVKWYRSKNAVIENMGGVKATDTNRGYDPAAFPSTTTATNLTIAVSIDSTHFIRMTNLDSTIHGAWEYYADVEHDSFPKLTIPVRPKKLVIGQCFDSLGAVINCQQLLVRFQDTVSDQTKYNLRKELGVNLLDSCVCGAIELWELSDTSNQAVVEALGRGTRAAAAQNGGRTELLSADPNYQLLGPATANAQSSPNFTQGSTAQNPTLVALIDSGVDYDNPKIQKRIWVNPDDDPNDGVDNDNDCEVDNAWGWNYLNRSNLTDDDHGHGTAVASLIGGYGSNNPLANHQDQDPIAIVPYKYTNSNGAGSVFHSACAIRHAADYRDVLPSGDTARVRVINTSWGYYGEPCKALEDAIIYAGDQCDILIVASAGNGINGLGVNTSVEKHWPSNSPKSLDPNIQPNDNVIAVGAFSAANPDVLASYSNYGAMHIDLLASGSTQTFDASGDTSNLVNQVGTSFSAPLVARAAALLFDEFPNASYAAVKFALLNGVDLLQSSDSSLVKSKGRLNFTKARTILSNIINPSLCADQGIVVGITDIPDNPQVQIAKVFPNPASDYMQILIEKPLLNVEENIELKLYAFDNQVLYHNFVHPERNLIELPLAHLSPGFYLLEITVGQHKQINKISKY